MRFFFIKKSVKRCHISLGFLVIQARYINKIFSILIEQYFIDLLLTSLVRILEFLKFSWGKCRVSDVEHKDVCEVMNWTDSVDYIWSEVLLSSEKDADGKGGDIGNLWNFGIRDRELSKKKLTFWWLISGTDWQFHYHQNKQPH